MAAGARSATVTPMNATVAGWDVPCPVRDEIAASWQRSTAAGLRPDRVTVPLGPEGDGDRPLARTARAVLDQIALDLVGAPVGVVLAGERGQVLDRRVDDVTLRAHLDRVHLAPGFVLTEAVVGTNGIGTAIARRRPTTVVGEEHFADSLTTVACAAAPIADPRSGQVVGVLALASHVADASSLMLPLATHAAREIEHRLIDAAGVSERLVLQRFLQERRQAKGSIVLLTPGTMITNAAAGRLLSSGDEPLLRAWTATGGPSSIVLGGGRTVTVRSEPLLQGERQLGTVLHLGRVVGAGGGRRRPRAGHPTFGWESLTETEHSVIELVAGGLTNQEAAERLFLSRHTVGFHLRSIFAKLGVSSRVALTRLAVERDLPVGG
ncbi:MAG: putative transcriptional regulator [Actinomycetia bacterium]|nr:putative transcriptional regulator [Actinomycetes bacterium]